MAAFFALGVIFILLFILIVIPFYIWTSLEFKKILKLNNYEKTFMAWIPVANFYALADATYSENDEVNFFGLFKLQAKIFKILLPVILIVMAVIPSGFLKTICYLVFAAFSAVLYGRIFAKHDNVDEKEKLGLAIVSGIIPIIALVIFTTYKKSENQ